MSSRPQPAVPEGEICCLFTDIEGSTRLSKTLSREAYVALIEEHNTRLREIFARYHGYEVHSAGDGFFVTFDQTLDAVRSAIAIQESLNPAGDTPILTVTESGTRPLQVRIGVYKAERAVFVGPTGLYNDREVNLAARIGQVGVGGQIIVSESAYAAVAESLAGIAWNAHENRFVRDFDTPQTLYEALWDGRTRPAPGARWMPGFLQRESNKFIGRDRYIARIIQWMNSERPLMVLHGHGGIGKTRLTSQVVLAVGGKFQGRIYGVALDRTPNHLLTPARLILLIAAAMEADKRLLDTLTEIVDAATDEKTAGDNALREFLPFVNERFATKPFLLVLDNFESANTDANRALLGQLLLQVRSLRCLVTCRVAFDIDPHSESLHISGLDVPARPDDRLEDFEGYRLFVERVQQRHPHRSLEDRASIVRILQYAEGSALCIELIAARYRLSPRLQLRDIAKGLETSRLQWQSSLGALGSLRADAPRHHSLEDCIDWSFQCLPPEEAARFLNLAVFPGTFDADAAEQVADVPADWLDRWILAHLVECETHTGRCFLLPAFREYAGTRTLREAGSREGPMAALEERFIAHYAVQAEAEGETSPEQIDRLRAEVANFHAAAQMLLRHTGDRPVSSGDSRMLRALGNGLWRTPGGIAADNLREALRCYERALAGWPEEQFPWEWSLLQNNRGNAFLDLQIGNRGENLQRAIACFEDALRVRARERNPVEWAKISMNLGNAYGELQSGDRAANIEEAIACYTRALEVLTEIDYPREWASVQNNLGIVLTARPTGDRAENLQRAIDHFQAGLRVRREDEQPIEWANVQNNLATAYSELPTGDREENLRKAIACHEAVLQVRSEETFPVDWATTQNNLGTVHSMLQDGDRAAHVADAITCYEAALRVWTEERYPLTWAITQFNIGESTWEQGNRAKAHAAIARAAATFRRIGAGFYADMADDWLRDHAAG